MIFLALEEKSVTLLLLMSMVYENKSALALDSFTVTFNK